MSTTTEDLSHCYCDPSTPWGYDCHESGCRAYAAVFFLFFLGMTIECFRRLWILRKNYKTATFISLAQLAGAGFFFTIRHILLMAKVRELFSLGFFLLFSIAFIISSYLWILIVWCNIIIQVNFSKAIQRVLPIIRYFIIFLNVALFIGFTIGVAIYWPWQATNIWIAIYVFSEAILFFILGYMIWRDYNEVSHISAHGKMAEETYKKVKKVTKLAAYAIASSILVAVYLWAGSMWHPTNDGENVLWLFIQRGTLCLMMVSMLICLTPPQNLKDNPADTAQTTKSSKFTTKMRDLAFSKDDESDDGDAEKGTTPGGEDKVVSVSQGTSNA